MFNLSESVSSSQEESNQGVINRLQRQGQYQNDNSKLFNNAKLEDISEDVDLLTRRKRELILKSKM